MGKSLLHLKKYSKVFLLNFVENNKMIWKYAMKHYTYSAAIINMG